MDAIDTQDVLDVPQALRKRSPETAERLFETIGFSHEVCESALAHTIGNKAGAAYRRGNLTDTLDMALAASRLRQCQGAAQGKAALGRWPQLYRGRTGGIYRGPEDEPCARGPAAPAHPEQDRTLVTDPQKPHPAGELLPARRSKDPDRSVRRAL